MESFAAAVASIPPASHISRNLHLKSRLPRTDGDVTVCTHCSLDRLERVEAQTRCWSGVVSAAVMCPCPCTIMSLRAAKRRIRALHARIEAKGGPCRLDITLVSHSRAASTLLSCRDSWQYPINALRNVALRFAATELVVLLDVDFLPALGIQEQLWKTDVYSGYFRACTELRRVVVLPALQFSSLSETINPKSSSNVDNDDLRIGLEIVSVGKVNVAKLCNQGKLRAFASDEFPPGHAATDTQRWVSSVATYEVPYTDGYEPFILCARRLVPWYDERFTGYGKNKIIHAFHIAVLDFGFWVHPEWYVVHLDHPASRAWQATLGNDPLANERLFNVKSLYEDVKSELVSLPSHTGVCSRETLSARFWSHTSRSGKRRPGNIVIEQMGHWSWLDKPSSPFFKRSSKEYLQALYDLRYHYCSPGLHPVIGWPLYSKLPRRPRDISLVTVATPDRLQRLSAQCRQWKGVICAAIYTPQDANLEALENQLLKLHLEVEKRAICRLDLILVESAAFADKGSCCCEESRATLCYQSHGRSQHYFSNLCPINALRNMALGLATTDLVLLLDVDLLPASSLNDCFLDEQQYTCLYRMTTEDKTALVVPSFEYSVMSSDAWTRNQGSLSGAIEDYHHQPARDEMGKKTTERESISDEVRSISHAEEMARKGILAISKDLTDGSLCGFHVNHYPAGHGPTDFERWREISQTLDLLGRPCCPVCKSYSVNFMDGFEPFTICSRKLIPRFDERFRGYGCDKVTFFYNLHLLGFRFRVLVHSFALEIPHAKSPDWRKTFGPDADPLQHLQVISLYRRAKREQHLITGVSAFEIAATRDLPAYLKRTSKKSPGFGPTYKDLCRLDGKHNRPVVEGLRPLWQGEIRRLCTHHTASSGHHEEQESLCPVCLEQEVVSGENVQSSDELDMWKRKFKLTEDEETVIKRKSMFLFPCFLLKAPSVTRWSYTDFEASASDVIDWVDKLEEFEWESEGWELNCSADSLANCSVVKALQRDSCSYRGVPQNGAYWLRISMSAGSWSPQASRLAGITTGGVAVRSVLSNRAGKQVLLRYRVRFPSSFQWAKGGSLPGFWIKNVMQVNFGWRSAGKGHLSSVWAGQSQRNDLPQAGCSFNSTRMLRPFYFMPGQWHALQLVVSILDQADAYDQDPAIHVERCEAVPFGFERSFVPKDSDHGTARVGTVLEIEASVDFDLVSKVSQFVIKNRQDPGATLGLLLSCYFGGKTQDWATAEDTHIDFDKFELWTDEGC